ncbi:MAG TPA: TonB-dependent receptor plug domain-containing protein, partial [Steroidobacteraceae bacterium]|nr:TonB-dependent receptor plug domain-containing protein [Steroidobacteraceae bacterium]
MEEDKATSGLDQHRRFGLALSVLMGLAWAHCACAAPKHFDLPAGDAGKMLNQFSQQAEMQLLFDFTKLAGRQTHAVVGDYEPLDALKKLIEGLPIQYTLVNDRTLALTMTPDKGAPRPRRWWQRLAPKPAPPPPANPLEQVLVAGSNSLDQPPPVGAALIRLDRVDIEQSGIATAQDFLRTLPQVFGGGPSEDTQIGREAVTNSTKGSGVNLRGLDAGATLVLINGQRTAPSGTEGLFADISGIPLSAIDHIDVLPDGASAQYGADAIGGIVNFVLRSNFTGAQTELRDGDFNDNPLGGRTVSQLFGGHFGSTTAMVGFELYDRGALPASDRLQATNNLTNLGGTNFDKQYGNPGTIHAGGQTFAIPSGGISPSVPPQLTPNTQNLYDEWDGADVLLDEKRWSTFGTLRSEVTDDLELSGDSLFTRRQMSGLPSAGDALPMAISPGNPFYFNPTGGSGTVLVEAGTQAYFGSPYAQYSVDTGNVGMGLAWRASDSWSVNVHGGYTFENEYAAQQGLFDPQALAAALADRNSGTALNPFVGSAGNNPATLAAIARTNFANSRSSLKIIGLNAGGALFRASGGNALLSLGVEYRDQDVATALWAAAP